jgi:hypothetical protein
VDEEKGRLAGTHQAFAVTSHIDHDLGPHGQVGVTPEQRFRVDPNLPGSLQEGEAFLMPSGGPPSKNREKVGFKAAHLRAGDVLCPHGLEDPKP